MRREKGNRGAALYIATIVAVACALGAYVILTMAMSQARHARFYRERVRARYATEGAIVWAQQRLWRDPSYCGGGGVPAVTINGIPVTIAITNCGPGSPHIITAQVTY